MDTNTNTISEWEAAYQRFETPEQEVAKFIKRLRQMGADAWPRNAQIVEIFCGRGNGLVALSRLGFTNLEGVDLSADLLSKYKGNAKTYVCDCRQLPFEDASRDIMIVQGGLHHLPTLPDDLERTLNEVQRVLRPGAQFMVVEPWLTPFLRFVHFVVARPLAAAMSTKVEALHTMIENERETYENWLNRKNEILAIFERHFHLRQRRVRFGKLMLMGTPH
jgi:ubiquinone/menaquinone biosynthesis C-methylase UbiE